MQKPKKIPFEDFMKSMDVFLNFPEVEKSMIDRVLENAKQILFNEIVENQQTTENILVQYLMNASNIEIRLRAVMGLTGGSLERLKRIAGAMFETDSWNAIKSDEGKIRQIAKVLIDPTSTKTFIPEFIKKNITLPTNWENLLQDEKYITGIASRDLLSQYSVSVGKALEEKVKNIVISAGHTGVEGKVAAVAHKSVDCAVPDVQNPRVLIMSSYNLTTASSQTGRANEQAGMYNKLEADNRANVHEGQKPITFVNVIDGGGWIERKKDLKKMWNSCHYCFSLKNLDGLKEVLDFAFSNE